MILPVTGTENHMNEPVKLYIIKPSFDEIEVVKEYEAKGSFLNKDFTTAANRAAFIKTIIPLGDIEEKSKKRLLLDTHDLAINSAGFDLIITKGRKGNLKQRFKSHDAPDKGGIMTRTENILKIAAQEKGIILPDMNGVEDVVQAAKLSQVNARDVRALGMMFYDSAYVKIPMAGKAPGMVTLKVDSIHIKPLFEGVAPLTFAEVEFDTEGSKNVLENVLAKVRGIYPEMKVVEKSKVQQALEPWRQAIAEAEKQGKLRQASLDMLS
jgi:hypothetical protein